MNEVIANAMSIKPVGMAIAAAGLLMRLDKRQYTKESKDLKPGEAS